MSPSNDFEAFSVQTPAEFSRSTAKYEAAVAEKAAERASWAKLEQTPTHCDALFAAINREAKLRFYSRIEPATPKRMITMLRKAGLDGQAIKGCIGPEWRLSVTATLERFILSNSLGLSLPLWAAVAMVLELDGRYVEAALKKL